MVCTGQARRHAVGFPHLFCSRDAAKMALTRENPEQTLIERELIGICSGFSAFRYRRVGARGPASTLLYEPSRIDPLQWLTNRVGAVVSVPDIDHGLHGQEPAPSNA
jgi:hypothetical protein